MLGLQKWGAGTRMGSDNRSDQVTPDLINYKSSRVTGRKGHVNVLSVLNPCPKRAQRYATALEVAAIGVRCYHRNLKGLTFLESVVQVFWFFKSI